MTRTPLYTLPEIAQSLGLSMAQLRGRMRQRRTAPPAPIKLQGTFKRNPRNYYNKEEFTKWFKSTQTK